MSYSIRQKSDWRIDAEIQKLRTYRALCIFATVAFGIATLVGVFTGTEGLTAGALTLGLISMVISVPAVMWANDDLMDYREEKHRRTQAELEKLMKDIGI